MEEQSCLVRLLLFPKKDYTPPAHRLSLATLTAREAAKPGPRFKGGCISSSLLTFLDSSSREKSALPFCIPSSVSPSPRGTELTI